MMMFLGWIHNWGDLSKKLLMLDDTRIEFRIPVLPDGSPHPLSQNPLNIKTAHDAARCLGLLLGTYRPKDQAERLLTTSNSSISDALILSVGSPMVEVFSIQINNIDGENPGDLYSNY